MSSPTNFLTRQLGLVQIPIPRLFEVPPQTPTSSLFPAIVVDGKDQLANQNEDSKNGCESDDVSSESDQEEGSSEEDGESDQEGAIKYPPHRRNGRRRKGDHNQTELAIVDDDTNDQRKSSFYGGKTDTLHTTILNEMRNKGLFKKLSSMGENYIPEELGKMRVVSNKPSRQPCNSEPPLITHISLPDQQLAVNEEEGHEPAATLEKHVSANNVLLRLPASTSISNHHRRNNNNTTSLASSQSGSTYSDTFAERDSSDSACHYNTGEEKEDKRLRDLHGIAREFYQVQKTYVELLRNIGENYPNYLSKCAEKSSRYQLNPVGKQPHVILRIAGHFQQILGVHKILLEDFTEKYSKWDSHNPDLAKILQQKAEFLKICNSFLKEKRSLCAELQQVLDDNKELALATKRFEDTVLNSNLSNGDSNGSVHESVMSLHGISLVMHLDAVHQNVVRYKLLMERYRKHLPDNLLEANIADEALKKLNTVSSTVNGFLADADADKKLLDLHRKLDGVFDVFSPGRRLIHEGELQRQTRKDLQLRYLILFSDTLLICRYTLGSDHFDASRIYKIPILRVNVQTQDHEDYEREFTLQSPNKSSAFVAKSKRERDTWVNRIKEARTNYRDNKRKRRSYVSKQKPSTSNSQHNSCEDSPDVEHKSFPVPPISTDPPTTTTSSPTTKSSNSRSSRHYEAVWIPDHKSTKCMMAGCDTKFSLIRRKHHCRQCGWLICRNCIGYAPVKVKNYEREKVCPQCYYDIKTSFEQGTYFPASMLTTAQQDQTPIESTPTPASSNETRSDDVSADPSTTKKYALEDPALRITYPDRRVEPVNALFTAPPNGSLSKTSIAMDGKSRDGDCSLVASGKVMIKNRKGVDVLRWARLNKDMVLHFYEAEFDDEPCESHFVYGYSLDTVEKEDGGCLIQLTHRNQFQTDRKEDKVTFQVMHAKSAEKWLEALQNGLGIFLEAE
uniref:Uncharacterized protein n=1 Tax=Ditylenchus dipsaci TaxID=166011 RepID=A0A915CTY1_9BILA